MLQGVLELYPTCSWGYLVDDYWAAAVILRRGSRERDINPVTGAVGTAGQNTSGVLSPGVAGNGCSAGVAQHNFVILTQAEGELLAFYEGEEFTRLKNGTCWQWIALGIILRWVIVDDAPPRNIDRTIGDIDDFCKIWLTGLIGFNLVEGNCWHNAVIAGPGGRGTDAKGAGAIGAAR